MNTQVVVEPSKEELARIKHREASKAYYLKKKAEKNKTIEEIVEKESAYIQQLEQENVMLKNQVAELRKICESYRAQTQKAEESLTAATLEYTARTRYMLDCAKHAYISMQFAHDAASKKKEGTSND